MPFYSYFGLNAIITTGNMVIWAALEQWGWQLMRLLLEVQGGRILNDFTAVCFPDLMLPPSCRERNPQPSAFHPLESRDHHLHLLFGLFWCLSSSHPHGALLPDSSLQPLAAGFPPCWVGSCRILRGCCHPVCSFIQVSVKAFSPCTVRCSGILSLGIEGREGKTPHPRWEQGAESRSVLLLYILTRVPIIIFSSLLVVMLTMSRLICAMAEDGLLFRGLGQIYARRGTPLVAILVSAILSGP